MKSVLSARLDNDNDNDEDLLGKFDTPRKQIKFSSTGTLPTLMGVLGLCGTN